ncbi:hypothetical protein ADEAN_000418600 [Angomonas deanei]|uniref:EF-hand domain-containing protein n=1 Tax=Angomonas deanei TaxID=59799 RepID=A0A7G2CB98_9TRYP|nr:hypothetical protein ADEAN_000418600 [Angomonas deanei]
MFRSLGEFQYCSRAAFMAYSTTLDNTDDRWIDKIGVKCCYYIVFGADLSDSLLRAVFYNVKALDGETDVLKWVEESTYQRFMTNCAVEEFGVIAVDSSLVTQEEDTTSTEANQRKIVMDGHLWTLFNAVSKGKGYFNVEDLLHADQNGEPLLNRLQVPTTGPGGAQKRKDLVNESESHLRRANFLRHVFSLLDRQHTGRVTFSDFQHCSL